MALDDRDRTFEKALARHLRYVAPSGEETGALTSSALPCPDPEILAAYHDGSLSPEERALWKAHVLSCDRCQVVLEHLATPVEVPVNALPDEKVLIAARSAPAATASTPAPTPSTAPAVQVLRPSARKNFFKWLVPAGAVAAGVLAYVAFNTSRTPKPMQPPQSAPVEVAKNEEPRAPQYDQAQSPAPADATAKNKETAEVGAARSKVARSAHAESKEEKDVAADSIVNGLSSSASSADEKNLRDVVALAKKAPNVAKAVPGEPQLYVTDGAAAARGANQPTNQTANQAQANQKDDKLREQVAALDAEMKKQGVARQAPAAPVPSSAGQTGYLGDNSVSPSATAKAVPAPPPPPPSGAASAKPAEPQPTRANGDSSLTASPESVEVANQLSSTRLRLSLLQNPDVLEAPGGKASWRFGAAGLIAHSTNKGKDWMLQSSGVTTTLIAGSAPSARVCWIVGASGTILRTTDGGAHWTKIASPSSADLAGVIATDALRAFIWFPPDARTGTSPSYRTTDGGSTWIPAQ